MNILKDDKKTNLYVMIIFLLLILITLGALTRSTISSPLEDESTVAPNSELTYYINIDYSGNDNDGNWAYYKEQCIAKDFDIESLPKTEEYGWFDDDGTFYYYWFDTCEISNAKSGYLYVEDVIPAGLTFNGFEKTLDGTIGAYTNDENLICDGYVIDDSEGLEDLNNYHGLHYDEETRTVSFRIKNLQAGCRLTIGIKTITPSIDEESEIPSEKRKDFYNFTTIHGNGLSANSNFVHAYMGQDNLRFWSVNYKFEGEIPKEVEENLPIQTLYVAGSKVAVSPPINIEGYEFSGWECDEVNVEKGIFTMPSKNITFKGSYRSIDSHKVRYQLDESSPIPKDYSLPEERNYYPNETVRLDILTKGDVLNDYRFLGWETNDVEVSKEDRDFLMPSHDITLTGKFEEAKYKVEYKFEGEIMPPNSDEYLPPTQEFLPGTKVKLENVISPSGFKFVGWNKDSKFEMPSHDVIVYGEWVVRYGNFSPTITNEIVNEKSRYKSGDTIQYKITITNTATFRIKDIIVKEHNEESHFIEGVGYEKNTDHFVTIPTIEPGEKVEVYAEYVVKEEDQIITNTAEIMGAINDNNYELNTDVAYKATNEITRQASNSTLKICKKVSGVGPERYFQFNIKSTTEEYETSIRIKENECRTIIINQGTYIVNEIIPSEYQLENVKGAITSNNSELIVEDGNEYEITFTNKFKRKGFLHSFGTTINEIIQERK